MRDVKGPLFEVILAAAIHQSRLPADSPAEMVMAEVVETTRHVARSLQDDTFGALERQLLAQTVDLLTLAGALGAPVVSLYEAATALLRLARTSA